MNPRGTPLGAISVKSWHAFAASAAVIAALAAAPALAVHDNSVQVQLRIVEQLYNGQGGAATGGNFTRSLTVNTGTTILPLPGPANRTRTFEVEYTLTNGSGATHPAGLAGGIVNITGPGASYSQALLTRAQAQLFDMTTNPTANQPTVPGGADNSGPTTGSSASGNPSLGVHGSYRGSFSPNRGNNASQSNGTPGANGILSIIPIAFTQTLSAPTAPDWYGLYSFSVVVPDSFSGDFVIHADFSPDPTTHDAFNFFDDGVPGAVISNNIVGTAVHMTVFAVPAPGSLVVLGMAGLVISRRRRPAGLLGVLPR